MKSPSIARLVFVAPLLILLIVAAALAVAACGRISTATGSASSSGPAVSPSQAASPSPRGPGTIAFTQDTRHGDYVCLINTDGTGFKRLAEGSRPAWSPDGSRIAYLAGSDLMVMDADGSSRHAVRTLTSPDTASARAWSRSAPAWSRDGTRLALTIFAPHEGYWAYHHLVVMNSDGSDFRDVIPLGLLRTDSVAWSPDGRIFCIRWDKGVTEVCSVKPDGSELTVVTPVASSTSGLSLSPDGTWLALYERGTHRLVRLLASGHGREVPFVQHLSRYPVLQWAASSWSPRGSRIALAESPYYYFPGSDLYIVNAVQGSVRQVPHTGRVFDPAWRPQ